MYRNECIPQKAAILVIILLCMMIPFGCANQTVSALDYSLENELYTEEQSGDAEQPAAEEAATEEAATEQTETTPAPEESAADATTPEPEATPSDSPETTSEAATPSPSPDNGGEGGAEQTPIPTYRYTITVKDESGTALSGARVTVYQSSELLFSELSGSDGSVSWLLEAEQAYYAQAELTGYRQIDNGSNVSALKQDKHADIILVQSAEESDGTATPTPLPVPNAPEGKVTITAVNVTIKEGDSSFSLKNGVSAKTENDETVSVWIVDDGGFNAKQAGVYTIIYGALENGTLITATRTVTVEGEETATVQSGVSAPSGSSKERYEILLQYRNQISDALGAKIAELTADYQQKISDATTENERARVLAETTQENDTDEMPSAAIMVEPVVDATVPNWPDVLATFLAQYVANEENPLQVDALMAIPLSKLDGVFWDMNQIEAYRLDGQTNVLLKAKTYEDMASAYHMSDKRKTFLYELMQPEFQRTFATLTGNTAFDDSSQSDLDQVLETLPENVDLDRAEVVEKALSLVGKVKYVWGGKYNSLGWSTAWGRISEKEAQQIGSVTSRSADKGLDCSGFVSWAFINATGDPSALSVIGNGSHNQWNRTKPVGWDEGRPGDLAFFYKPGERQINHVGIIVSVDADGSYLVAHCSSKQHGVVVTDAWSTGFRYIRRPAFFE